MLSPELKKIAGHESRAKSERARGFNEKNGKVTTGTPATVQGLERRLRTLFIAALIRDPRLDTGAQIPSAARAYRSDCCARTLAPIHRAARLDRHVAARPARQGPSTRHRRRETDRRSPMPPPGKPARDVHQVRVIPRSRWSNYRSYSQRLRWRPRCQRRPRPKWWSPLPGVVAISQENRRRSLLSRGRSSNRCGPRLTGW